MRGAEGSQINSSYGWIPRGGGDRKSSGAFGRQTANLQLAPPASGSPMSQRTLGCFSKDPSLPLALLIQGRGASSPQSRGVPRGRTGPVVGYEGLGWDRRCSRVRKLTSTISLSNLSALLTFLCGQLWRSPIPPNYESNILDDIMYPESLPCISSRNLLFPPESSFTAHKIPR